VKEESMAQLDGKVCVVTGAAGGIGGAAAAAFVQEGGAVGLLDRSAAQIEGLAQELGDHAFALPCDVTDGEQVAAAFGQVESRFGRLDVLYTCAAVQLIGEDAPIHEVSLEVWERTQAVNMRGVFLCCREAARLMIAMGIRGSIINCGSPTGLTMCGAGFTAYSASKAGVMGLTRVMAADLAAYGIRVNGIVPGTIETPLTRELIRDPEIHARLVAGEPIGRIGTPEDMAGIAVFLASDASSFATGAHFHVDGGITVR
jgi:NAD(P)-dependent dehydrogenase (short-subunit alcohol dehydrogenase family)